MVGRYTPHEGYFRPPVIRPAVPACFRGAGVAADAPRRAAARIADTDPRLAAPAHIPGWLRWASPPGNGVKGPSTPLDGGGGPSPQYGRGAGGCGAIIQAWGFGPRAQRRRVISCSIC